MPGSAGDPSVTMQSPVIAVKGYSLVSAVVQQQVDGLTEPRQTGQT
jgi:hypothetical protein